MNQLQAIPTTHGLSILTSSLKSTIKQFKLLGNIGPESADVYEFYSSTIHASYYDENGVLTFEMRLPTETHFDEYMYKVHIVDEANAVVIECETPKVALPKGIGGMLTLKSTVTGSPGDLVFQNSDFLTETEFMARFASKMQAMPYDPSRTYSTGETCYTKDAQTGELSYWQWYSNVESLSGKNPLDITNRHTGWADNTKPFYWIPYTGEQVGMPFFWLETEAPEWAVMEINVDLPIAVYWRLARRYPQLVNGDTINTGEIRGEFLRILDQGRGVDSGRDINDFQNQALQYHNHKLPTGSGAAGVDMWGVIDSYWQRIQGTNWTPATGELAVSADRGYSIPMSSGGSWSDETRPRNVSRAAAIAI
ncbi:hypothetical protein BCU13_004535 [Vibrio lentus]|uniref:hypothetical protein n=1 Tax=Vibrio lentus TaxID=136468 RepID=UPI000C81D13A|nr:hypothetical protein [Vibrio lentus]